MVQGPYQIWIVLGTPSPPPPSVGIDVLVDILAKELYLEFFIHIWIPDETYLDFETGVLHRISIQIS